MSFNIPSNSSSVHFRVLPLIDLHRLSCSPGRRGEQGVLTEGRRLVGSHSVACNFESGTHDGRRSKNVTSCGQSSKVVNPLTSSGPFVSMCPTHDCPVRCQVLWFTGMCLLSTLHLCLRVSLYSFDVINTSG